MPADRPLTHFTCTSTVNSQSSSEYSNILTQMYSRGKNRAPNQTSYAHRPIDPFSNNHPFYISKLNLNYPKWHTLVPNYKFRFPHNIILTETTPKTPISHKTDTSRYTLVSVNNSNHYYYYTTIYSVRFTKTIPPYTEQTEKKDDSTQYRFTS